MATELSERDALKRAIELNAGKPALLVAISDEYPSRLASPALPWANLHADFELWRLVATCKASGLYCARQILSIDQASDEQLARLSESLAQDLGTVVLWGSKETIERMWRLANQHFLSRISGTYDLTQEATNGDS